MKTERENNLTSILVKSIQQILVFKHRYKSRKALLKLDERMLNDIGITHDQAQSEGNKPFWKGDSFVYDKKEYLRLKRYSIFGRSAV